MHLGRRGEAEAGLGGPGELAMLLVVKATQVKEDKMQVRKIEEDRAHEHREIGMSQSPSSALAVPCAGPG